MMILNPRHRRSPRNLTIDDVYADWVEDGGIFGDFSDMPWSSTVVATDIGIMYGANSAMRFIAPIVYKFLNKDGEFATGARAKLASAVKSRFIQKWTHLWELYNAEYNPLDTYNLTESGSKGSSDTKNESYTHGHVITDGGEDSIDTDYGKITTDTGEPSVTEEHQRQGFNSTEYQAVTKDTTSNVTDNVETLSGTDTSTTTYGKTETHSGVDYDSTLGSYSEEYSSTKSGLMYRAPAELMDIDRTFWIEDYFSIVFSDIDSVITLAIYPEKEINTKVY